MHQDFDCSMGESDGTDHPRDPRVQSSRHVASNGDGRDGASEDGGHRKRPGRASDNGHAPRDEASVDAAFTEVLAKARDGDAGAASRLYELLYQDMRALAARLMAGQGVGHTLGATALANEAYIKLAERTKTWNDRGHALAAIMLAMRQVLVDHARRKQSAKRSRPGARVPIEDVLEAYAGNSISIVDFHEQLERLFDVSPQVSIVVALHIEHGFTVDQIALMLDTSPSTAARLLERGLGCLR